MAITGLGMILFVIFHLAANLTLFNSNPVIYNAFSNSLLNLGFWLYAAEIILLLFALIHIYLAYQLKTLVLQARPIQYNSIQSKGKPSKFGFSSTRLPASGTFILIFLIIHIIQFKYGPGITEGYSIQFEGKTIRDLHRIVVETFHYFPYVLFYMISMILLGFHLRHGVWGSFQSLGITRPRTSHPLYIFGTILSLLIALGFFLIPIFIYFNWIGVTS